MGMDLDIIIFKIWIGSGNDQLYFYEFVGRIMSTMGRMNI